MPDKDEVENMPIWQDHEQRIAALEATMANFHSKMDSLEKTFKEESGEQKKLLNRLIDHHLDTNKMKINNFWKLLFQITGAGGLLGTVIYALFQFFNF